MAKGKDFYGKDIAEVIEQACKDLAASREELDIEVLETGSAGIFGLCKKKAHIRARRKDALSGNQAQPKTKALKAKEPVSPVPHPSSTSALDTGQSVPADQPKSTDELLVGKVGKEAADQELFSGSDDTEEKAEPAAPSSENLEAIRTVTERLLTLMGMPSEVQVLFEQHTVQCTVTGPHEAHIIGPEGRTLDSLQYLLRKMVSRHLPDKVMLALNAGDFREKRMEELKERALVFAEQVKADGKTRALAALNPSERRFVHMALQEDKEIRSRSVGDGLFKKVLIYKPGGGKGRRFPSKKR